MICAPSTGCAFIMHPLFLGQPLLLEQDGVRHADLADVVEQAAPLERLEVRLVQAHRPPDVARDLLHAPGVLLVNGSRLSTAPASAVMVWVNISRISMKLLVREAGRVQRQREQQAGPPRRST